MQSVRYDLRNHPKLTEISTIYMFSKDSADIFTAWRWLANTLQRNRYVSRLHVTLIRGLFTTEEDIRMHEPFLQYLRNAPPTMQTIYLDNDIHIRGDVEDQLNSMNRTSAEHASRLVLHALAENEFLKDVTIHWRIVSLDALATFAAKTRIQSLTFQCRSFGVETDSKAIADIVCSFRTLECLTLLVVFDDLSLNWKTTMWQSMLEKLDTYGRLHTLSLILVESHISDTDNDTKVLMEVFDGLARYLQASVLLKTLKIEFPRRGSFKKRYLELLLGGVAGSVSLVKLALDCRLDEDSKIYFSQFFQARRTDGCHSIRELHLGDYFTGNTAGKLMASALTPPGSFDNGNLTSSFGASLQMIVFDCPVDDFEDFFQFLSTNVSKLPKLELHQVKQSSLQSHLPGLIHLRDLKINHIKFDLHNDKPILIDCFRRNGSLRKLTRGEVGGYRPFFNETEWFLVQSFCTRNCQTVALLSDEKLLQNAGTDGPSHPMSMVPILFLVARPAERTAPNTVFAALLFGQDCIGPK